METVEATSDTGVESTLDIDAAADRIGASLFPDTPSEQEPEEAEPAPVPPIPPTDPLVPAARQVPKSWPKEMHEHWGKTDPKVQDYWETREKQMLDGLEQYKSAAQVAKEFHQVMQPFDSILKAQNLSAPQAVQYLLHAHQRLTQGTLEQRQAAYHELGTNLGFSASQTENQPPVDPALQSLQQQMAQIQSGLNARQQADYAAVQEKVGKEVDVFASDPSHPHFNAVADDIVLLLKTGLPLQDAYEKAVWANPLTREKELQVRLTSESDKQKERARLEALPKAKALRANIRSVDSKRAPTEPIGTMADTMKDTLREIRSRAS